MNKIKLFIGAACLVSAFGAAAATKVLGDGPADYYYNPAAPVEKCIAIATTECPQGAATCKHNGFQVYDYRVDLETCDVPLQLQ
ncbi:DUF6520 family protein [uncultured Chitinophaga sp.]|uniref:DUF6520 family protein n=1 Tax=uncultured Chitinophaga sp. TaxID=339340 RepID=UPI0025FB5D39|nr:DUF6520 family protein [uncultured Chitinophaga sp.]